jgi:hypothetical protein
MNCGLAIVPPGATYAGMSCRCFTATGKRLDAELDAIRSRLQALEQNTVPSGSAEQKPREWWIRPGSETADYYVYKGENDALRNIGYIRVREVLDE